MMKRLMQSTIRQYAGTRIGVGTLSLPPSVVFATALVFIVLGIGPNTVLAAGSLLVFLIILALVWGPGEPPILMYLFAFQWLEASIGIFYANFHDVGIDGGTAISGSDEQFATVLSLVGLLVQSVGVRLAAGPWRSQGRELAEFQLQRIPQSTWFRLYIAGLVVSLSATLLASMLPGLSQPLLSLVYLKWAAYVIFTFATFFRSDASRTLWFLVFLLELLFSIGGYFSSFKFVFIFTFFGIAASEIRFSNRLKLVLGIVTIVAILFGSIWSSIKGEYRYFVSGGQQAQVVTVGFYERIDKLEELISDLNPEDILHGFDLLVRRIGYVEYFGDVTSYVPGVVPHTNGVLWLDAITRPLMPRLFFPDKPSIDESSLTTIYTGREVAGFDEGTQISIGYMAESYIDFGQYGMMVIMLLWGLILGWVYRWLVQGEYSRGVLGIGLVSAAFLMTSSSIGNSSAKLFGGLVVSLLVIWLFIRFVVPRWLPWLRVVDGDDNGL